MRIGGSGSGHAIPVPAGTEDPTVERANGSRVEKAIPLNIIFAIILGSLLRIL
jgi:hypothetical protein